MVPCLCSQEFKGTEWGDVCSCLPSLCPGLECLILAPGMCPTFSVWPLLGLRDLKCLHLLLDQGLDQMRRNLSLIYTMTSLTELHLDGMFCTHGPQPAAAGGEGGGDGPAAAAPPIEHGLSPAAAGQDGPLPGGVLSSQAAGEASVWMVQGREPVPGHGDGDEVEAVWDVSPLAKLTQLRNLKLSEGLVHFAGLPAIAQACSQLTALDLLSAGVLLDAEEGTASGGGGGGSNGVGSKSGAGGAGGSCSSSGVSLRRSSRISSRSRGGSSGASSSSSSNGGGGGGSSSSGSTPWWPSLRSMEVRGGFKAMHVAALQLHRAPHLRHLYLAPFVIHARYPACSPQAVGRMAESLAACAHAGEMMPTLELIECGCAGAASACTPALHMPARACAWVWGSC